MEYLWERKTVTAKTACTTKPLENTVNYLQNEDNSSYNSRLSSNYNNKPNNNASTMQKPFSRPLDGD